MYPQQTFRMPKWFLLVNRFIPEKNKPFARIRAFTDPYFCVFSHILRREQLIRFPTKTFGYSNHPLFTIQLAVF